MKHTGEIISKALFVNEGFIIGEAYGVYPWILAVTLLVSLNIGDVEASYGQDLIRPLTLAGKSKARWTQYLTLN